MDPDHGSDEEEHRTKDKEKKPSRSKKDKTPHKRDVTVKNDASRAGFSSTTDQQPSLWDLAIEATRCVHSNESQSDERSILFVGSKDAGKTSIILRFLDRDDPPKPTTALEYTFGRRAKGNNLDKDIAHIWELGGGTWLSKLADITINADTLRTMSVALVLDLSKPTELWLTLDRWLEVLRLRIAAILQEARDSDGLLIERLKQEAWQRIGEDHEDRDKLDPMLIPIVIVGSKYDVFQDFDPETRKVICKTLRFVAHRNGTHLQFVSTKHEALLNKMRSVMNHLVFATPLGKSCQTDHSKPLIITAGQDSLQAIGNAPLPEGDLGRVVAKNPVDLWKHAFVTKFPQQISADPSLVDDPAKDRQYAETAIDAMRAQKNEELERYRRASERKAKESMNKSLADGFVY